MKRYGFVPQGGFTPIEVLLVLAIIAVLIGLLLPAVNKVREGVMIQFWHAACSRARPLKICTLYLLSALLFSLTVFAFHSGNLEVKAGSPNSVQDVSAQYQQRSKALIAKYGQVHITALQEEHRKGGGAETNRKYKMEVFIDGPNEKFIHTPVENPSAAESAIGIELMTPEHWVGTDHQVNSKPTVRVISTSKGMSAEQFRDFLKSSDQWLRAPFCIFGEDIRELLGHPSLKIEKPFPASMVGPAAIEFGLKPFTQQLEKAGFTWVRCQATFDPSRLWALHSYKLEYLNKDGIVTVQVDGTLEYPPDEPASVVPNVLHVHDFSPQGKYLSVYKTTILSAEFGPIPTREFTAKSFGLDDSIFETKRPALRSRWGLGFAAGAILFAVAGGVLLYRRLRSRPGT